MAEVLIAYASIAGSTAEVAEAVGNAMKDQEIQIDVRPIREVQDVTVYGAVIVGAPMIVGWHKEAMDFVQTNQAALGKIPVAYFITCIELTQTGRTTVGPVPIFLDPNLGHPPTNPDKLSIKERRALSEGYLQAVLGNAPQVEPVSVGFFGGKIDYSKLKLFPRLFVKVVIRAEEGDRRNWQAIQMWAEDLGHFLVDPLE
jgi:menaquinone-dependent protoporphyrinogen oxidase